MVPLTGFEPVAPSLRILNEVKDFRKDKIPRADKSSSGGHTSRINANGCLTSRISAENPRKCRVGCQVAGETGLELFGPPRC